MWPVCLMQDVYVNPFISVSAVDSEWESKPEASSPAAFGPLLKIRGHCCSAVENANTKYPRCISGKWPCSPGCGTSQIMQSPVSPQEMEGIALITAWSPDIIRTRFRCSANKPKEGAPTPFHRKPYYVEVEE